MRFLFRPPAAPSRPRAGFTMLEAVLAITIGMLLLAGAWTAVQSVSAQRRVLRQQQDIALGGAGVSALLRTDLERAGTDLFATYNWSGVRVDTGTVSGYAADTVTAMWGAGRQWVVSAALCAPPTTDCVVVAGDPSSELAVNDLVVVGSPGTGARLFQIAAIEAPALGGCGSDCDAARWVIGDYPSSVVTNGDTTITAATHYAVGGVTVDSTLPGPCSYSFLADGRRCVETVGLRNQQQYAPWGAVSQPRREVLTTVRLTDRSSRFGVPALATMTLQSGAGGLPLVRLQKLAFARYAVDYTTPASPQLMRTTALTAAGAFTAGVSVVEGVRDLTVEVQHVGQTTLARGMGFRAADLVQGGINPNYVEVATATTNVVRRGWTFARSARTLAAVRVRYTVLAEGRTTAGRPLTGARRSAAATTVVATPRLLDGGTLAP